MYDFKAVEANYKYNFSCVENSDKPKYYVLEMFPYPSGRIHVGHLRNYVMGDVVARYKMALGFNVLHPIGWDSFGLPAENAAMSHKIHPSEWTSKNIRTMKAQLMKIGLSYDWSREVATCLPEYYKHEQKFFLDFLKHDLAYRKEATVNWDPVDNTVLANEQVVNGCGWRSGVPVERKKLAQWFLRVTDFTDDLLESLKSLDKWPQKVCAMQEKWIGKSEGVAIEFDILGIDEKLLVFTTRPDTIFGASFCAIASDHPLIQHISDENMRQFIQECNKSSLTQESLDKAEKLGIYTNLDVQHPFLNDVKLPIYIVNFVLMEYGTGAVFGCPAHDQRDLDFAIKYQLPIKVVIAPADGQDCNIQDQAYFGVGTLINSDFLNGMDIGAAKRAITQRIEEMKIGYRIVNYRLRDWGVSRQRYWGCPIPVIHCDNCGIIPVPEEELPITLPHDVAFDKPGNPLDHHPTWKHVKCPKCQGNALRETDTLDTFFESAWYFLYFCSRNEGINRKNCMHFMPVDIYIGGIEHAILHLLYARFFTRALTRCGYIDIKEPFTVLLTQGMICHKTFKDEDGNWLFPEEAKYQIESGKKVIIGSAEKMSKSKKNVVDPINMIERYGADAVRLFILSDSPPERDIEWSDTGIGGALRYLSNLFNFISTCIQNLDRNMGTGDAKIHKTINKLVYRITDDLDKFVFNRAIARIREMTNILFELDPKSQISYDIITMLLRVLEPITPHITQYLWEKLGNDTALYEQNWPTIDESMLTDDEITIAVQVNGKVRATVQITREMDQKTVEKMALDAVKHKIFQGAVQKVIVVKNKVVNIVVQ